ncbi:MAG: GyrI-like domain-containing protein [Myxococcota bacterium]
MAEIEIIQAQARTLVGIRRKINVTELPAFFAEVLPKTLNWLNEKGIPPASAPMAKWCSMDMETGIADTHAGFFVAAEVDLDGEFTTDQTAGGDVIKLVHQGGYDTMGQSWGRVYGHASELGRAPGPGWEIYVDDPVEVPADELKTEIYLPIT